MTKEQLDKQKEILAQAKLQYNLGNGERLRKLINEYHETSKNEPFNKENFDEYIRIKNNLSK